ncbi:MAG: response regulator [Thermoflexales bacterium]|nr:response regulator [Thermoflexales bacterium]
MASAQANGTVKTVLVIEDSQVQRLVLSDLLEQEGARVLCAAEGSTGVSMAQQHQPDAIVLDLEMPGMGGLEACRVLKDNPQTASIPVVVLTAYADRIDAILQGFSLGAIDFIPKDAFSEKVLLETLRQLGVL